MWHFSRILVWHAECHQNYKEFHRLEICKCWASFPRFQLNWLCGGQKFSPKNFGSRKFCAKSRDWCWAGSLRKTSHTEQNIITSIQSQGLWVCQEGNMDSHWIAIASTPRASLLCIIWLSSPNKCQNQGTGSQSNVQIPPRNLPFHSLDNFPVLPCEKLTSPETWTLLPYNIFHFSKVRL